VHIIAGDYNKPLGGVGRTWRAADPAALCNAIFAGNGKRIRRLPIGDQLGAFKREQPEPDRSPVGRRSTRSSSWRSF